MNDRIRTFLITYPGFSRCISLRMTFLRVCRPRLTTGIKIVLELSAICLVRRSRCIDVASYKTFFTFFVIMNSTNWKGYVDLSIMTKIILTWPNRSGAYKILQKIMWKWPRLSRARALTSISPLEVVCLWICAEVKCKSFIFKNIRYVEFI